MVELRNWAGNFGYGADRLHRPDGVEQVQEIVARARRAKALGTRHSFNAIADTEADLISLENLRGISIDPQERTVTLEGGVAYGELCRYLNERGWAIHNLASLPHISVAGACATGTHGSGDANGNLATAVVAMSVVTADGEIVEFAGDDLAAAAVHLGGLGVVARLTLGIQPAFSVAQSVYDDLPLDGVLERFEEIMSCAYSVSLFTRWQDSRIDQVWVKRRAGEGRPVDLGTPAPEKRHPIRSIPPENCTEQLGVPGPWHERLPHFRLEYMPSAGKELQSEYLAPRRHAVGVMRVVSELGPILDPILQISEVRTMAADELWMSPAFGRPTVGIHFTWTQDWARVSEALPIVEEKLAPFEARPHWGKLFAMSGGGLAELYPRMGEFRALLERHDPKGKFRNAFLERAVWSR
ncbi:MAG TPA: FAD-binding protein [Fimbriimonadaceae bacterium]|nr:FAD-binding protein [Fimbriimonadaceae bacterium]